MQMDWILGLAGGLMIGCAAAMFLLVNGRIMGASGLLGGLVDGTGLGNLIERAGFIAGLVGVPAILVLAFGGETHATGNVAILVIAGLLVGVGTRVANGCTSGHGVCGISRLSLRGITATMFYLVAGGRHRCRLSAPSGGDLMRAGWAFLAGGLFGAGLWLSGMTDTRKVQGWLDIFGDWDPTLAFVLGGAILPMAVAWRLARRGAPKLGGSFPTPSEKRIGWPLAAGSMMFGAGWGLVGLCPGPAMASLTYGGLPGVIFLVAMIAGMIAAPPVRRRLDRLAPTA